MTFLFGVGKGGGGGGGGRMTFLSFMPVSRAIYIQIMLHCIIQVANSYSLAWKGINIMTNL